MDEGEGADRFFFRFRGSMEGVDSDDAVDEGEGAAWGASRFFLRFRVTQGVDSDEGAVDEGEGAARFFFLGRGVLGTVHDFPIALDLHNFSANVTGTGNHAFGRFCSHSTNALVSFFTTFFSFVYSLPFLTCVYHSSCNLHK